MNENGLANIEWNDVSLPSSVSSSTDVFLGAGTFGVVIKAIWTPKDSQLSISSSSMEVAIKTE